MKIVRFVVSKLKRTNEYPKINLSYISITKKNNKTYFISNGEDTLEVPKIATDILKLLNGKNSLSYVKNNINDKYNNDINIYEFLMKLKGMGFLENKNKKVPNLSYKIGKTLNRIIFNKYAKIIFYTLFLLSIYICIQNFSYYFGYKYTFIFKNTFLSIIFYLILSWISVLFHEMTHYFSASGYGVHSKISLGTRLQFLVAQTSMDNPYKTTTNNRIHIYMIGIITDALTSFICIVLIYFVNNLLLINFLRCILYIKFGAILWQFLFYMKTDVYYAITCKIGETNLMMDSINYIKNKNEKNKKNKILKYYSIFLILGRTISIIFFIVFTLPLIIISIQRIGNTHNIYDSISSIILLGSGWGLFVIIFAKNKLIPYLKNKILK